MLAADRLHMAAPDLEAHPEGEYWMHRAMAAVKAENLADEHKRKRAPKR
jgi:hypothetical protein